MKNLLPLISILFLVTCKNTQIDSELKLDLLDRLKSIPGFTVNEIAPVDHFQRLFEIHFTQYIDHQNPAAGTFQQKIFLGHVDESAPVVLETEGYSRDNHRTRQLAEFMQVNQIAIEHRYYGESVPNPRNWQYLNIEQAANDIHRIVQLIKSIYTGKWVSSGRSKGGDTALFHRRFFPNDVDGTIAFVAPLVFAERDSRFETYLNTVGDPDCRDKLKSFQRNILLKIDSMPPLFADYIDYVNTTYNVDFNFPLSAQKMVKHGMLDFPFEFWSSYLTCDDIPADNANAEQLFNFFVEIVDIYLYYSDYGIDFWTPYFYQTRTELGDYFYDTSYIDDLLGIVDEDADFSFDFGTTSFDPGVMIDIDTWLKSDAENMIFIYGGNDPWTVSAVEIGSNTNIQKFIASGLKHDAYITDLLLADQQFIRTKLSEWLNWYQFQ